LKVVGSRIGQFVSDLIDPEPRVPRDCELNEIRVSGLERKKKDNTGPAQAMICKLRRALRS
jgi:hypothetical protein